MPIKIDEELLQDLSIFLEDDLAGMIDLFISHSSDLIAKVVKACGEQNVEQVVLYLHSFKGGAKNMGALSLEEKCLELEARAKSGDLDSVSANIHHLNQEINELSIALKAYVKPA